MYSMINTHVNNHSQMAKSVWPQLKLYSPKLVKSAWFELHRQLMGLDLLPNHAAYRPFIILGRSRTGTTLLLHSLAGHPEVLTYGEILRHDKINWASRFGWQTPERMARYTADPVQLFQERIYSSYPKQILAVGCKLFYYHAYHSNWNHLWDYLANRTDLSVIHVTRRNLLAAHVSRQIAGESNEWNKKTAPQVPSKPIVVDYERCRQDFERTQAWETEFEQRFSQQHRLMLTYEDLSAQFSTEIERVQQFLGVTVYPLAQATVKLSKRRLADRILNYATLKAEFAGTEWASFFDED